MNYFLFLIRYANVLPSVGLIIYKDYHADAEDFLLPQFKIESRLSPSACHESHYLTIVIHVRSTQCSAHNRKVSSLSVLDFVVVLRDARIDAHTVLF